MISNHIFRDYEIIFPLPNTALYKFLISRKHIKINQTYFIHFLESTSPKIIFFGYKKIYLLSNATLQFSFILPFGKQLSLI